jgi:aspartyl-tRNA(Asn)/glutamyl-tRNA(Gln) amidotransferase subunit A
MSKLTDLTIAEARDGLKKKSFSATELTDAHIKAVEKARALNAFVTETPEIARAAAAESDKRIAAGAARPLDGIPLGIKDLFCTKDVLTTAGSHILDGFKPAYESTVTSNLWRDGAVMLGKLNMDEFAMGSSNETSYYGNVINPWRRNRFQRSAGARWIVGRLRLDRGGAYLCMAATGTDTGGSIRQPAAVHRHGQASSRPMAAARAGACRRLCVVARPGRTDCPRQCVTRRSC